MSLGTHLTENFLKGGTSYPAGTKVSEIPNLSDEEKDRLERLELTGSKKDAEAADDDG